MTPGPDSPGFEGGDMERGGFGAGEGWSYNRGVAGMVWFRHGDDGTNRQTRC